MFDFEGAPLRESTDTYETYGLKYFGQKFYATWESESWIKQEREEG